MEQVNKNEYNTDNKINIFGDTTKTFILESNQFLQSLAHRLTINIQEIFIDIAKEEDVAEDDDFYQSTKMRNTKGSPLNN